MTVKHEGQVPTCRKCHLPDHVARSCPNTVCFNCDKLGHTFRDCPEVIKCSICKEDSHYAVDCRLSWWRQIETAADNEENLLFATAVLQPTLRPPAGDLPFDVSDRASPSSSLPTASSVPPSSPDAPIDVSESATAVPVSSGISASSSSAAKPVPVSDASMDSSVPASAVPVPQSVDSALAPPDDFSDSALAAAASNVSVAALADQVLSPSASDCAHDGLFHHLPRKQRLQLLLHLYCFPLLLLLPHRLFLCLLPTLNRR